MKASIPWSIALGLAGLAASEAQAVGRLADVVIVDRDSGAQLPVHRHHGEWWVEGRPGARYAIRIHNAGDERLLAVTSVDGVNVVTGETAGVDQSGYIYDRWNTWDITGWRKTDDAVAAFEFTSVPRSYAARTGRPANVGVIGVALCRERPKPVVSNATSKDLEEAFVVGKAAAAAGRMAAVPAPAAAPGLGTGHGRCETSVVMHDDFERAQARPNELIRLRYDSHANLVALGVLPAVAPAPGRPDAFPSGPQLGYVPDP